MKERLLNLSGTKEEAKKMINIIIKCVFVALVAYILGNISPARIIGRIYKVDVTQEGSGNPGTTNVIRILGLKAGLITLLIDVFKAFIAVKFGISFGGFEGSIVAFIAVIIGHCFPILYSFKGGKGVACALGAAFALNWPSAAIILFVAIIVLLIGKRMSVASLSAAIVYPVIMPRIAPEFEFLAIALALFLIITHIPNIKRLIAGEEKKLEIGKKK